MADLEAKNGRCLRLSLSDGRAAAALLRNRLGAKTLTLEDSGALSVREPEFDTGEAVRLLVEAGISVRDVHLYEDSLEDYFRRITGGEGIA